MKQKMTVVLQSAIGRNVQQNIFNLLHKSYDITSLEKIPSPSRSFTDAGSKQTIDISCNAIPNDLSPKTNPERQCDVLQF